jgi:hypothetical protein
MTINSEKKKLDKKQVKYTKLKKSYNNKPIPESSKMNDIYSSMPEHFIQLLFLS